MTNLINNEHDNFYFNNDSQCNYYTTQNLGNILLSDCTLNIIHINIRSTSKNLDELLLILEKFSIQFDVIVITETWLKSVNDWTDVEGYDAYHSIRENKNGGGVTILVNNDLCSENLTTLTCNNDCHESVGISLDTENDKFVIIGTYRPPSSLLNRFNTEYFEYLSRADSRRNLIILGDFNVDTLNVNRSLDVLTFIDNFKCEHLQSLINLPTRKTHHSETCLDHIYVNTINTCPSGVIELAVSDHHAVFCSIPYSSRNNNTNLKAIKFRDHSDRNIFKFREDLINKLNNFHNLEVLSIHDQFEIFNDILFKLYDKNFPIKTKNISNKRNQNPWITNALLNRINEKHRLFRLWKDNPDLFDVYKNYRNNLSNEIQRAKRTYFVNKFNNHENPKATWKSIGKILKPNIEKKKIKLSINNSEITDDKLISNTFNEYFSSVASKLASKIPHANTDPISYVNPLTNSFVFLETDYNEINKTIQSFPSKRSHKSDIPSFIYKQISDIISPIFASLINSSVASGVFPNFMKIARVIPLHKSGSKSDVSNYRPISTLPFLSKVYERIIHKRLLNFFLKYNVLYNDQYGFLPQHDSTQAILKFTDQCYSCLNKGHYLASVFLDFSKAFDTVVHSILCKKLEKYGIRGNMNKWFQSYLKDRTQFVEVNGVPSRPSTISCSVPQGSILGPLCFLIYINDMHKSSTLNMVHFADDSTAFTTSPDLQNLTLNINSQLENISNWLCANKLSLNVTKSSFTIFTNKPVGVIPTIKIRNLPIAHVKSTKFLGINLDNKLNFGTHISSVCSKISKSLAVIRKLSRIVPLKVLKTLYTSLTVPHVIYGIEVWGSSNKTQIKRLINILNKCLKLITGSTQHGVSNIYHHNKLLDFNDLYKYFCLVRMYKYFRLGQHSHFSEVYSKYEVSHLRPTRFRLNKNLNIPQSRLSICKKSFVSQSIGFWNNIPLNIKECPTLKLFKYNLRLFYLQS